MYGVAASDIGWGRLAPHPPRNIHINHQAVNCAKFLNFGRFLKSKSVNNVCKLL